VRDPPLPADIEKELGLGELLGIPGASNQNKLDVSDYVAVTAIRRDVEGYALTRDRHRPQHRDTAPTARAGLGTVRLSGFRNYRLSRHKPLLRRRATFTLSSARHCYPSDHQKPASRWRRATPRREYVTPPSLEVIVGLVVCVAYQHEATSGANVV
jgi:hypothetical protein